MDGRQRDLVVDFFRGVIIIEMILVHFSRYLPNALESLIKFADVAIEGFIFLSGFMIGKHYLDKFKLSKKEVTKRLLLRSLKLALIQYILIITIILPFYLYFEPKSSSELIDFILSSILFLNQLPIIHILPTFIPLFIISPIILVMLGRNWNYRLIFASITVFLVGCYNPYIFNLGEKTIFPVVLWQIYFVLGSLVGKLSKNTGIKISNKMLLYGVLLYSFALIVKYGGYFDAIDRIKSAYEIYPKKFPLNIYGVLYGCSFLFVLYAIINRLWGTISKYRLFAEFIPLLGRNSLVTFVVHAYFVYLVKSLDRFGFGSYLISISIAFSLYFIYIIIHKTQTKIQRDSMPLVYVRLFS